MSAILNLKTLKVLDPPGDPGSHIELQLEIILGPNVRYIPSERGKGHSIDKKAGTIWHINESIQINGNATIILWETDTGSDDNYGSRTVSTKPTNCDDPINCILSYGRQNDCSFILSYSVSDG